MSSARIFIQSNLGIILPIVCFLTFFCIHLSEILILKNMRRKLRKGNDCDYYEVLREYCPRELAYLTNLTWCVPNVLLSGFVAIIQPFFIFLLQIMGPNHNLLYFGIGLILWGLCVFTGSWLGLRVVKRWAQKKLMTDPLARLVQ